MENSVKYGCEFYLLMIPEKFELFLFVVMMKKLDRIMKQMILLTGFLNLF